ncbi:hypothetical protein [uncultured Arcticibacterium sp.]|uniref:hypothetical protein n=1 Tax=uncultured Arcticibacterium sp. TaxID=2173042 RepID=UPI0030FA668E
MSKKKLAKDALKSFLKTVKKIKSFDLKKTFSEDGKTYSLLSIIVKHKKGDVPEPKLATKSKKDDKKSDKSKAKKTKSKSKKKVKTKEVKAIKPAPKPATVKTAKPKTSPVTSTKTEVPKSELVNTAAKKPSKPEAPKPAPIVAKAPVKKVTATRTRKPTVGDNLKLIEGIGPKIESFLKEDGIDTFEKLAKAIPEEIQKMLVSKGGTRYNANNPTTWPEQASVAAKGDMEALNALKLELKGGRRA